MKTLHQVERVQTVVIGAGQAGLSVGYHLARRGLPFVILDANQRIGDSWRKRWDSLRLFTPAAFDGLDGMPFPAAADAFPTKDEMGDFLETYAKRFALPVRTGVAVDEVSKQGDKFFITAGNLRIEATNVVIAMAKYQRPHVPSFAKDLDPSIVQLHSIDYRNPSQLQPGGVLIVGAGNSGAEIGLELARAGHPTWISGRDTGELPFRIDGRPARWLLLRLMLRFVFHRVLTTDTAIGRRIRPKLLHQGGPLIRTKSAQLAGVGVSRVPKTLGVQNGLPVLEDGRVLDVTNVVWCTGFSAGHSWIQLPVFDEHGDPLQERGLVARAPGLYFVGLHFLYALSSTMIHGVGRDAERVVEDIAARAAHERRVARGAAVRDIEAA